MQYDIPLPACAGQLLRSRPGSCAATATTTLPATVQPGRPQAPDSPRGAPPALLAGSCHRLGRGGERGAPEIAAGAIRAGVQLGVRGTACPAVVARPWRRQLPGTSVLPALVSLPSRPLAHSFAGLICQHGAAWRGCAYLRHFLPKSLWPGLGPVLSSPRSAVGLFQQLPRWALGPVLGSDRG